MTAPASTAHGDVPYDDRTSDIVCRPIGFVRSPFTEVVGMPIQTAGAPDELARVKVLAPFVAGLRDIEGFDYLILVTHFHRCAHERLEVTPFLDDKSHGVFATRAPTRRKFSINARRSMMGMAHSSPSLSVLIF